MARLPQPGGDDGNWGEILNDYLLQIHTASSALKDDSVGASQLQNNAVTAVAIADGTVSMAKLASGVQASLIKADNSLAMSQGDDRYVRFVDQNGNPLPAGSITTIIINTTTGEIDDITFEVAS